MKGTSGECELSISSNHKDLKGDSCVWLINGTGSGGLLFLLDDWTRLAPNDSWSLQQEGKSVALPPLHLLSHKLGLVWTPVTDTQAAPVTLTLSLDPAFKEPRVFGLRYTSRNTTLSLAPLHAYHLPLNPSPSGDGAAAAAGATVHLNLSARPAAADKRLLLQVESASGEEGLSWDNVATPPPSKHLLQKDGNRPILLSMQSGQVVLTTEFVDAVCSRVSADLAPFEVDGAILTEGPTLRCFHQVAAAQAPVRADYSSLVRLLAPSDLLTVSDGDASLALFTSGDVARARKDVRTQLALSRRLTIRYSSDYVSRDALAEKLVVRFSLAPLSSFRFLPFGNETLDLTLKADAKSEADPLFLIETPRGTRASFRFKQTATAVPFSLVDFFADCANASEVAPFASLAAERSPPPVLVSPTNVLRIRVTGSGEVQGIAAVAPVHEATAIGQLPLLLLLLSSNVLFRVLPLLPAAVALTV